MPLFSFPVMLCSGGFARLRMRTKNSPSFCTPPTKNRRYHTIPYWLKSYSAEHYYTNGAVKSYTMS